MTDKSKTPPSASPPSPGREAMAALREQLEAELFSTNKATLFNMLEPTGVTSIIVSFDGYGDSGQIEDVEVRAGGETVSVPEAIIEIAQTVWGQSEPDRSTVSIATAVESLAYDVLERTHGGWENNDGAYGDIVFDVAARTVTLDYNERYTASENHTHSF